jgi:hypothetical protein
VYSLYLDASGTHGASPVYILAGLAVHEQDAYHLQQRFSAPLAKLPGGPDPRDYELHATEMKRDADHRSTDRAAAAQTSLAPPPPP